MPLCCIVFVFEGARPSRAYLQSFPQLSCSFENQLESCPIVEESCHLVTSFNIPCAHNATGTVSIAVTWSTASSTKKSKGHLRRSSASFRIAASCATHACEWLPRAGIIRASPCGLIPHFPVMNFKRMSVGAVDCCMHASSSASSPTSVSCATNACDRVL